MGKTQQNLPSQKTDYQALRESNERYHASTLATSKEDDGLEQPKQTIKIRESLGKLKNRQLTRGD